MSRIMQMQFTTMSVKQLPQYSINDVVTFSGHLKLALVDIASCVERKWLPSDPNFENDEHNQRERRLIIHDMQIKDSFTMTTQNKGHTARTRFGNATRILDSYGRLTSDPFNFFQFSNTFQQFKLVDPHILQNFLSCSVLLTLEN